MNNKTKRMNVLALMSLALMMSGKNGYGMNLGSAALLHKQTPQYNTSQEKMYSDIKNLGITKPENQHGQTQQPGSNVSYVPLLNTSQQQNQQIKIEDNKEFRELTKKNKEMEKRIKEMETKFKNKEQIAKDQDIIIKQSTKTISDFQSKLNETQKLIEAETLKLTTLNTKYSTLEEDYKSLQDYCKVIFTNITVQLINNLKDGTMNKKQTSDLILILEPILKNFDKDLLQDLLSAVPDVQDQIDEIQTEINEINECIENTKLKLSIVLASLTGKIKSADNDIISTITDDDAINSIKDFLSYFKENCDKLSPKDNSLITYDTASKLTISNFEKAINDSSQKILVKKLTDLTTDLNDLQKQ